MESGIWHGAIRVGRARAFARVACAVIAALLAAPTIVAAATYRWNADANGDWNNAANWLPIGAPPGFPNAPGDVAQFPASTTTADRVITIPNGVTITVGGIQIDDDHIITIQAAGTGTLVMDDVDALVVIDADGAAHRIAAPLVAADEMMIYKQGTETLWMTGGISESGGPHNVHTDGIIRFAASVSNTYTGTTSVNGGRLELAHTGGTIAVPGDLRIGALAGPDSVRLIEDENIAPGSRVSINTDLGLLDLNGRTETFAHLHFASGGDVTIGDGVLTVDRITMAGGFIGMAVTGRLVLSADGQGVTASGFNGMWPVIGGGTLELGPGDHPFQVAVTQTQIGLDITSKIVGPGTLTKTLAGGGGTLRLAGGSTYTGPTTVLGGGLLVEGAITSAVTLNGGELHGNGLVGPVTGSGGRIHPGAFGPGTLSTGSVALGSQVSYHVQLTGDGVGSNDQLSVTGAVALNDAHLNVTRAFDPAPGQSFIIVNNNGDDPIVGIFANKPEGTTFNLEDDFVPFTISYVGGDGNDVVLTAGPAGLTYKFAEGATGGFFDTDLLIANPNDADASTVLTFFKEDGTTVVVPHSIPAKSRVTVPVDQIEGLESSAAAIEVRSVAGLPLAVERTMFWDASRYGGHTDAASESTSPTWAFAEGAQGFFDTYFLVQNPHAQPVDVTFTFLREQGAPFVDTVTVLPNSRFTLYADDYGELQNQAFGTQVSSPLPIVIERAMYFGSTPEQLWTGGHASAGADFLSQNWVLAEGATGEFFDTFILMSNPQNVPANVMLKYLLPDGQTVERSKNIPAMGRLTVNIETEDDPRLHHTAVSTLVQSNVGIVVERSMYWQAGAAQPWGEAHHGVAFSTDAGGERWGLAEGRVGGPLDFSTYILLANFDEDESSEVSITYLREAGAPIVKAYTVPATTRVTIDVRALVPELQDESFGAIVDVTSGQPVYVERAMYWNANGILWAGGTNGNAVRLPQP